MNKTTTTLPALLILIAVLMTSCLACIKHSSAFFHQDQSSDVASHIESVAMIDWVNPPGKEGRRGTAFALTENLLMTAGHICVSVEKLRDPEIEPVFLLTRYDNRGVQYRMGFATIAHIDNAYDVCILNAPLHPFKPLEFTDAYEELRVGTLAYITGFPYGFLAVDEYRLTAITQEYMWGHGFVYPGHSGSPILVDGKIIGLVSAFKTKNKYVMIAVPAPVLERILDTYLGE